ncbi:MAG TPA: hypothetical protein VF733_02335, partial [Candidatus Saccharimonadales bacterium]
SNGMWVWRVDPTNNGTVTAGTRYAVQSSHLIYMDGEYQGIRDSRIHEAFICNVGVQCSVNDTMAIDNMFGPGPDWVYNNEVFDSTELVFNAGSAFSEFEANNLVMGNYAYIRNYVHDRNNFLPATITQTLQNASVQPVTNIKLLSSGPSTTPPYQLTGEDPATNTVSGWSECPNNVVFQGAPNNGNGTGASQPKCNVGTDTKLHFTFTNGGQNYSTPPGLAMSATGVASLKNQFEHKTGSNILYYGNIATNIWANGLTPSGAQKGNNFMFNQSPSPGTGVLLTIAGPVYLKDNWFDMAWVSLSTGGLQLCTQYALAAWMADMFSCMIQIDPYGKNTVPTTSTYGYGWGVSGGKGSYMKYDNNLVTTRDIADDLAIIPSSDIWKESSQGAKSPVQMGPQMDTLFVHNTIDNRPGYTQGAYAGFNQANSYNGDSYTSNGASVMWNSYIYSTVVTCAPLGSMGDGPVWVRANMGCPTAYGQGGTTGNEQCSATIASGGDSWPHHYWGVVMYNDRSSTGSPSGNCYPSGPGDWTVGGLTSNALVSTTALASSAGAGNACPN